MKVKIKMLRTASGCDNGYTVAEYKYGCTYEVNQDLAACFLSTKDAILVKEEQKEALKESHKKSK